MEKSLRYFFFFKFIFLCVVFFKIAQKDEVAFLRDFLLYEFEPPFPCLVESLLSEFLTVIGPSKILYLINFVDEINNKADGFFDCFIELLKTNGYERIEKRIRREILPLIKKKTESCTKEISPPLFILRD